MRYATLLTLLAFYAGAAHARGGVAIVNIENSPVIAASGGSLSIEAVGNAIVAAGASKGYPWTVSEKASGKLKLSTLVRGKHTVVVDVSFDTSAYSIRYSSSINMNYKRNCTKPGKKDQSESKCTEVIHPYYNTWVQELKQAIDAELLKS
jgi:uncharacterized protein (UPF0333 family)